MAGTPQELSADDAAILALESSAIAGHTVKAIVLEPGASELDLGALRASVAERIAPDSRGRQRVELGGEGGPRWVVDERFDVAAHVRRRPDTAGLDDAGLWRAAGEIMSERLDHARPLWAIDLIGPLADGREVLFARVHHAMADGISSVRFLGSVLWHSDPDPDASAPANPPPGSSTRPAASARPPERTRAAEIAHLPGALRRELGARASESPLDRRIGSARELAFATVPLAELRRIAATRPEHTTVNDVLLAIVAGALREWLAAEGRLPALRAQIPVSLHHREEGEGELGNRDSFLNVDLPRDEPDPLARLDRITAETSQRKRLGDAQELYDFFHALARFKHLGRAVERFATSPHEFSLSISNVPGPRGIIRVLERRVEYLGSAAEPADRHALRVSAISCSGTVGIGLCTDPEALPGVGGLAEALHRSRVQLSAAAPA
jgi:diacylglycerol O-acyltransferase